MLNHDNNVLSGIEVLETAINTTCKDELSYKIDLLKLKGRTLTKRGLFTQANKTFK